MEPFAGLCLRAAYLLALAIAPPLVSPAGPSSSSVGVGVLAAIVLAALVLAAGRFPRGMASHVRPWGRAASLLLIASVVAAIVGANVFQGDRAPLGRGVVYVAAPFWLGLALVAGVVAAKRLGQGAPRFIAAVSVVALGAVLFGASASWLLSPRAMWLRDLRMNGDDTAAVVALLGSQAAPGARAATPGDPANAERVHAMDDCIQANPSACACLAARAQLAVHDPVPATAIARARDADERCPRSMAARATFAEVLALYGDAEQAEQEARAGLEQANDGLLHYALAIALGRVGRQAESLEEAKRAVKVGGGGRDAAIYLASIAIAAGDLETARAALLPVIAADPNDADAQYDLALVADRKDDYNLARQGYLAALRADPMLASARYNLTLLALRHGAVDEARHHAERYATAFPRDPRGSALAQSVTMGAATAAH